MSRFKLHRQGRGNAHRFVRQPVKAGLEQQRHIQYNDGRAGFPAALDLALHPFDDERMGDGVELPKLLWVLKHLCGQCGAVQGMVVLKDGAAEGFPDSGKGLAAGGGQASADGVRIDDGRAQLTEHISPAWFCRRRYRR